MVSWAGMRGVVTLAAAFLLPEETPQREVLQLAAFVVVAGTLLIQGTTLPWLVARLRLPVPSAAEDALQAAALITTASRAGLARLEEVASPGPGGRDPPAAGTGQAARQRRLGAPRAQPARARAARGRLPAPAPGDARRRAGDDRPRARRPGGRRRGAARGDDGGRHRGVAPRPGRGRRARAPTARCSWPTSARATASTCARRRAYAVRPPPDGCEECLREGLTWVHLRLCLTCGHVGCCDSSVGRHATGHFNECAHPVIRSFEPGEAWRWCYRDQMLG